ncbi:MAG: hypothetical protein LBV68_04380 [Spirochaetaceae bacterium]|nr:hypothetical protein [Spirochaetaceae bacterium]
MKKEILKRFEAIKKRMSLPVVLKWMTKFMYISLMLVLIQGVLRYFDVESVRVWVISGITAAAWVGVIWTL